MFVDEDFINWGRELFEKAKKIHRYKLAHQTKVVQIIENFKKKYNLSNDWRGYENVRFISYRMTDLFNGHEEVKDYWIDHIVRDPFSFEYESWEDSIRSIIDIDKIFYPRLIDEFKETDFDKVGSKFLFPSQLNISGLTHLNIRVPFMLSYYEVEFAIEVIENLTKSEVTKISLYYFTSDFYDQMNCSVYIGLDDSADKHYGLPYITKHKFLNFKFSSIERWFEEIPEFKTYIDKIHQDERDFPICQTCGDSNYVSNSEGSYWWCFHCKHSIDQEGNCVSDGCETCRKQGASEFNEDDGPFYLFFDTETTGVPKDWKAPITNFDNWPRIIQLAWLVYDSKGNQILKNEYIIKPNGFQIPIEASNVHGITTDYALSVGVSIEEVLLKFEQHCEKSKYLIAHNINFDSKVTGSEYLRILSRNPISKLEHMCTMESSTDFCKIPGSYGYKWPKLSELHIKLFGVDFEGAHDALADIEATAKCFWEMKKLKLI